MRSSVLPVSNSRLIYIDNLRVFAMLLGILVHTTTIGEFGSLEVLGVFSDFFRMSVFFMVSGFFASLLLQSREAKVFYIQRITNVVIPLVTALLLLNPLTLILVFHFHNSSVASDEVISKTIAAVFGQSSNASGPLVWHLHLWFLFSLTFYILMAFPMRRLLLRDRFNRVLDLCGESLPAFVYPAFIALLVAIAVVLMRLVAEVLENWTGESWLVRITLGYWPFYLLGMTLYWRRLDWDKVHRLDPLTFVLSLAAYALFWQLEASSISGNFAEAVRIFALTLARCGMIFLLLYLFRALFNRQTVIGAELSDSIYTVYIFHFLVIYLIASILLGTPNNSPVAFFTVSVITAIATFSLHRFVIRPVPAFRFMFNGRIPH
jgi:glucan biosynthesis protein C